MKTGKAVKGQYGYISRQRVMVTLRTILMFTLALAIFGIGYWSTGGNKKNLLTVVAILACLPACKSAVNMIMFFRAGKCPENVYQEVCKHSEGLTGLYDMYFTSYDKSYPVFHLVVKDNLVCGYCNDVKCESGKCEKHLEEMLKQGGCKHVAVKIYKDLEKYCEGLDNLQRQQDEKEEEEPVLNQTEDILNSLLAVTL